MTYIIGLAGPGHVGKSTTAKKILEAFNTFTISNKRTLFTKIFPDVPLPLNPIFDLKIGSFAFAMPIYELVSSITGFEISQLKDETFKETPWTSENSPMPCLIDWTPRKLLQIIGTECFRNNVNKDFWIELSLSKIKNYDIAICEDSRFSNEYKKCDIVIELERDGIDYLMNHASAMPPDKKYVWKKIKLHNDIDYKQILEDILLKYIKDKNAI